MRHSALEGIIIDLRVLLIGDDDDDDVSCGSGWPQTCYIVEDDFELLILLNSWITGIPGYTLIPQVNGIMQLWRPLVLILAFPILELS